MNLRVVKYASRRSRMGDFSGRSSTALRKLGRIIGLFDLAIRRQAPWVRHRQTPGTRCRAWCSGRFKDNRHADGRVRGCPRGVRRGLRSRTSSSQSYPRERYIVGGVSHGLPHPGCLSGLVRSEGARGRQTRRSTCPGCRSGERYQACTAHSSRGPGRRDPGPRIPRPPAGNHPIARRSSTSDEGRRCMALPFLTTIGVATGSSAEAADPGRHRTDHRIMIDRSAVA